MNKLELARLALAIELLSPDSPETKQLGYVSIKDVTDAWTQVCRVMQTVDSETVYMLTPARDALQGEEIQIETARVALMLLTRKPTSIKDDEESNK